MDFPLGVDVHCSDGRCGRSTYIILNPVSDQLTHIVVKELHPSRLERLVPSNLVKSSAAEVILLNCDKEEFSKLEPFNQTYFVRSEIPHYVSDPALTLLWPYAVATGRTVDSPGRSLPEGELAVHRLSKVYATDGLVGRVDGFLVDPETCQITDLVVRDDRLVKEELIVIPLSYIKRIRENKVYLSVKKAVVEEIPPNHIDRSW
jgi:hypothetical protein